MHQSTPNPLRYCVERLFTLNNPLPPASQVLQLIQTLTNLVYLTQLDAGDKVKVRNYMTVADEQLARLKHAVMKLALPNLPQQIN